jgi:hypothetical protein
VIEASRLGLILVCIRPVSSAMRVRLVVPVAEENREGWEERPALSIFFPIYFDLKIRSSHLQVAACASRRIFASRCPTTKEFERSAPFPVPIRLQLLAPATGMPPTHCASYRKIGGLGKTPNPPIFRMSFALKMRRAHLQVAHRILPAEAKIHHSLILLPKRRASRQPHGHTALPPATDHMERAFTHPIRLQLVAPASHRNASNSLLRLPKK